MPSRMFVFLLLGFCCLSIIGAVAQVSPEDLQKIEQAAPDEATNTPDQPRKLLVFTRAEGFKHDAIPYATQMLEILAKKTGAFEVVAGDDMGLFKPESLRRFDAVLFNNTTQLAFNDPALRQSLLDFVKGGKGIIGIHAATDNFYDWPEAAEMMGGTFDGHPWTADGTWKVAIEDPTHPVMAAFEGKGFSIRDEIYRTKTINLRKNYRVLMGLDMKDEHNRKAAGVRNSDKDIPISWIGNAGKGRLFYCSLGHNREVYWNRAVVRHYLDGIQYALGDLSADATPLPFNSSSFFDQEELDRLLTGVSSYTYGQSRQPMQDLDAFIRYVSDITGARDKLEEQFLARLRSDATLPGKQFICSRLGRIGTGASVPTLVGLLADTATYDMAMFALELLPGEAVNEELCRSLSAVRGTERVGTISALGRRRALCAVPAIETSLTAPDQNEAVAAASALADIGGLEAVQILTRARARSTGPVLSAVLDACLRCAEKFTVQGEKGHGLELFKELYQPGQPALVRLAALRGIVGLRPESAGALIVQSFQDTSARFRSGAMQLVRDIRDKESLHAVVARINSLAPASQAQLLSALDDRRDAEVQAAALAATKSKQSEVRTAAFKLLGRSGDASVVRPLAYVAARGNGTDQRIARQQLQLLNAPAVDDSIVALVQGADAKTKMELLGALRARRAYAAVPILLREANDRNPAVRTESAKALRTLARADELPAVLDLVVKAGNEQERKELELTTLAVVKKDGNSSRSIDAILEKLRSTKGKNARVSLLTVLGKTGDPAALPALRSALEESDSEVRLSAIRSLSAWPTPEPVDDLWRVAQQSKAQTHRALALRGVVRLLGLESTRPADETVALYKRALALAPNLEERKRLISGMADAQVPAALTAASAYISDGQLHAEAELVTVRIAENVIGSHQKEVISPLRQVTEKSHNPVAVQRAKELLTLAGQFDDFMTTWEYSGPYTGERAFLFTTAFAPEDTEAVGTQWKLLPAGTNMQKPWLLEFDKVIGGTDRVVYVRNRVWSDSSRKALFELGSDDGIKLWMNGELVHANDVGREVKPGEDKVEVQLKEGWNRVLMKISQRTDEWGACARLRALDGSKLQGIRVARVNE